MSRKETLRNTREIAQAPRILARHGRRTRRDNHSAWIMGLITVTIVFFLLDIAMGPVKIPLKDILKIILGEGVDSVAWTNIVEQIRLPKACTAVLVGCALSVGGLLMQTLFRNPLAGPEVLGLTSGASLGVSLVMLASGSVATIQAVKQIDFLGGWILVLAASTGSAITLLIVLSISLRVRDNVSLLIIGMMIGTLTISLVSLLLYFSSPEEIQDYLMWTFGSIGGVTGKHLFTLFSVVSIGLLISLLTSKPLNMLLLGENYARTMGLAVRRSRILIIAATSLLAGGVTAFCGPIGFVGLAVPHLARALLNTSDHLPLTFASCLLGSIIILGCDILSQLPGNQTILPLNVVTALIGAPVVIWVICRKRNASGPF